MLKHKLLEFLTIALIGTILAVIITWPFASHISTYYTDQGDYPLAGSVLWYNQKAIKTGLILDQQKYFQGYQFYPQPYSLAFANNAVVPSFIFAPIFWVTNNLSLSVNIFAILTLILSFISAYYTFNYFVKSPFAAIIGAAIFAFNPQTMVRFPHHLDILNMYFVPLVFLFGYRFLESPTIKKSLLFFLVFSLNALSVTYYFIFTVLLLPFAAIPFLLTNLMKNNFEYFSKLVKYSLVGLVFLPVLLYFNLPYLDFSNKEGSVRSAESSIFFSARILDWFASAPNNLIYSSFVKNLEVYRAPKDNRGILNYEEHTLFLNILPFILFMLGWKIFKKQNFHTSYFYILLGLSFIFTFGSYFTGNGDSALFPLPLLPLYKIVPLLQGIRAPTRFEFIFYIPFALIVCFGVQNILIRWKKYAVFIIIILLAILSLENFNVRSFNDHSEMLLSAKSLDQQTLSLLIDKNVLHIPVFTGDADEFGKNARYLSWLTVTGEKIFNGDSAYRPPDQMMLLATFENKLGEDEFKKLLMLGVDYVIIHKNFIADYQSKYAPLENFYSFGKIYDKNNLLIIDLHKYKLDYQVCDFKKDFTNQLKQVISDDDLQSGYGLVLKNNSTCYLPTTLSDRYQKMSVKIDGQIKTASFRVPLLIGPMEQVVLTELNHELKVE